MSFSDGITYIIAFLTVSLLIQKVSWIKEFIESQDFLKTIAKTIVLFIVVYFIAWSFLNALFYVNMGILMRPPFNYGFFKSFHIAITLTNEYSSMGYYMEWFYHRSVGDNNYDLMNQLVDKIHDMYDSIGGASANQSALSTLQDISRFFF